MAIDDKYQAAVHRVTRDLIDQGLLVEAGWQMCRLLVFKPDTPTPTLDAAKEVFFAGAQHLFASVLSALDEDREPTVDDLQRMEAINRELQAFDAQFRRKYGSPSS